MEIERKFLIDKLPENLETYPRKEIAQGYINREPVIRIRRSDDKYILTCKGQGLMVREEFELPLTKEAFEHLKPKTDGIFIENTRYLIPYAEKWTIELDEFSDIKEANTFIPPAWFGEDVTDSPKYHNSNLSKQ